MVSTTDFIAAIELGSSKIAGIAGKRNKDGSIQVLAYASEPSASFVKRGIVFNLDKAAQALISIRKKLEEALDSHIGKVYVGVCGQSLRSVKNVITRELEEETIISRQLIDSMCDENRSTPLSDMDILDVAPQEYKIGIYLQADPVGVAGNHIEGRFLNLTARSSVKKNLEQSFSKAGIPVEEILVSPLVMAEVVLTDREKSSGCALIDFGADTTTVSIYEKNILRFLTVIPLGGNNITRDLASLQMEEQDAEKLKIKYGDLLFNDTEKNGQPDVGELEDGRTITLQQINEVVSARAEEIIANAINQIELSGFADKLLSGIIITGGGSNLKNMEGFLREKKSMKKIRVAETIRNEVKSASINIPEDGTQNTILGLLAAGKENCYAPPVKSAADAVNPPSPSGDLFSSAEELEATRKKKEEEEKERRAEEKKRKEKEKKKIKIKTGWITKFTKEIFEDDSL